MKRGAAVDAMPEFEPLTIASSNLMIEANALRAQGEIFESAVKWVEAGRKLAELGTRLLHAGHTYEAAQDILNAAACSLEVADFSQAVQQLDRFEKVQELSEALHHDQFLNRQHEDARTRADQLRKSFDRTRQDALTRMRGDPLRTDKLPQKWIDEGLREFPAIPMFHWAAAQRCWYEEAIPQALLHYSYCVQLSPFDAGFRIIAIGRLLDAEKWRDAIKLGLESTELLPGNFYILWFTGWARVHAVMAGKAQRSELEAAKRELEQARRAAVQFPHDFQVTVGCTLSVCLTELGKKKEAKLLLESLIQDFPSPASDIAFLMLRAVSSKERDTAARHLEQVRDAALRQAWPRELLNLNAA